MDSPQKIVIDKRTTIYIGASTIGNQRVVIIGYSGRPKCPDISAIDIQVVVEDNILPHLGRHSLATVRLPLPLPYFYLNRQCIELWQKLLS
jgi:hypothetical protein